ncbi:MAG: maleylpyruvate isomerase family mycothiol-dependent enzyme [Kineosporiaceae bacterium]
MTSRSEFSAGMIGTLNDHLIGLVERAPDPAAVVPHTDRWTIAQVMAHLVTAAVRYSPTGGDPDRWAADAKDVAALNDVEIAQLSDQDLPKILTSLRAAVAQLPSGPSVDDAGPLPYTGGVQVHPADLLGIMLGEFVVHGHDIARALGRPWSIDSRAAVEILDSLAPILPAWVDPQAARGVSAVMEVRLRGAGRHLWQFTDGHLEVDPAEPRPVDVTISADPVAFLLLSYRRMPLWRAILTGRSRAWGRRPMLAFRSNSFFRAP